MSGKEITIAVSFKASPGAAQEWLDNFKIRADDVLATEPGTLAYGACQSKEDPHDILVFERYVDQAAVDKHGAAPGQAALNKNFVEKKLSAARNYQAMSTEAGPGFWPQGRAKNGDKGSHIMLIHMHCAAGKPADFFEKWAALTPYVKDKEPNTLAYQAFVVQDAPSNKGFKAGEDFLIFEQYVEKKDLDETHMKSAEFKAMNKSLGPVIKAGNLKLEPKFSKDYEFTGVGFLSRQTPSKL